MADEPIHDGKSREGNDSKDRSPWMKRLIFIGAIILVVGVEIGISYVLNKKVVVPKYFSEASEKSQQKPEKIMNTEEAVEDKSGLNSNIFLLENIVVNPRGTNGMRYIAMAIGMGVTKSTTLEALRGREIQIRDAMNSLLADKPLGEFVDMDRREKLKKEILATVNEKIEPHEVESIYFTEYVIQ